MGEEAIEVKKLLERLTGREIQIPVQEFLEKSLAEMLYRNRSPDSVTMGDVRLRLSPADRRAVESFCALMLNILESQTRSINALLEIILEASVPLEALNRTIDLFNFPVKFQEEIKNAMEHIKKVVDITEE